MEDVFEKETNERGKRTREIHYLSKGFPSPAHMVLFFPVYKIAALSPLLSHSYHQNLYKVLVIDFVVSLSTPSPPLLSFK